MYEIIHDTERNINSVTHNGYEIEATPEVTLEPWVVDDLILSYERLGTRLREHGSGGTSRIRKVGDEWAWSLYIGKGK
jgi:hypothetical protein